MGSILQSIAYMAKRGAHIYQIKRQEKTIQMKKKEKKKRKEIKRKRKKEICYDVNYFIQRLNPTIYKFISLVFFYRLLHLLILLPVYFFGSVSVRFVAIVYYV